MLISSLPKEQRQAAENERERQKEEKVNRSQTYHDELSYAFDWEESPQGKEYWESIYYCNEQKEVA